MSEPCGKSDAGDPDNDGDQKGRKDMSCAGLECGAEGLASGPSLLPRNQRDRDPVIRHDGVQDANRRNGADQE